MDALMDALGYVGDALEKPGRAVRGVLAGKGREALAAVPFSDSLGLTDAKQKTTGRDLTDLYGITRKGDDSFGAGALGFGADMVTDPLNLIAGYGAYRAAPTVAKGLKAGAKAVSGLDLIDALKTGGRGARNLLHGEAGAIGHPEALRQLDEWHKGLPPLKPNFIDGEPDSLLDHLPWVGDHSVPQPMKVAASAVGPQYEGGIDKMEAALKGNNYKYAGKLLYHSNIDRIASELPEGSRYLGNGAEAVAFKAPDGHVIRMAPETSTFGSAGRADIQEILQPFRSQMIHSQDRYGTTSNPWIVEHLPLVNPIRPSDSERRLFVGIRDGMSRAHGQQAALDATRPIERDREFLLDGADDLADQLHGRVRDQYGKILDPWDFHGGNVAFTPSGALIGHDGGMISAKKGLDPISRWSPPDALPNKDLLEYVLRNGGPEEVRNAMARGNKLGARFQGAAGFPNFDLDPYVETQKRYLGFLKENAHYAEKPTAYPLPGVSGFESSGSGSLHLPNGSGPSESIGSFKPIPDQSMSGPAASDSFQLNPVGSSAARAVDANLFSPENLKLIEQGIPSFEMTAFKNLIAKGQVSPGEMMSWLNQAKINLAYNVGSNDWMRSSNFRLASGGATGAGLLAMAYAGANSRSSNPFGA